MAANLSLVMDDTDKVRALRDDAIANGLEIVPPDVNASNYRFEPIDAQRIRYGLGGIKGHRCAGDRGNRRRARKRRPFRDLGDFCRRVDKRIVNRRAVEALIRGGAFDSVDARRATLFASVGVRCRKRKKPKPRPRSIALGEEKERASLALVATREWTESERLTHEKAALGFLSVGTSVRCVRGRARAADPAVARQSDAGARTGAPRRHRHGAAHTDVASRQDGVHHARRRRGAAEIVVFNETFDASRALLREDQLVIVEARVMQRNTEDGQAQGLRVVAEAVYDLAAIRKRYAKGLRLACNGGADAGRLAELIAPFRNGTCPIVVEYVNHGVGGELELPDAWNVNLDDPLLAQLREWLTPDNVQVVY
jgi:DNA polymerase-3 subunit alpha